jgi:hypothetical protein
MNKYQRNNNKPNKKFINRAKRLRIKNICYTITLLSFLYLLGIVGGFENDAMTFGQFIPQAIVTCTIFGVSARIGYDIMQ